MKTCEPNVMRFTANTWQFSKRYAIVLSCVILLLCSYRTAQHVALHDVDFRTPVFRYFLPDVLHEISGITWVDSTTLACIQDEDGIIFMYDLRHTKITRQIRFAQTGDFEGLCKVKNTYYVLQSDGVLYEVTPVSGKHVQVIQHHTGIPAHNSEGLCYDEHNNRLLIGVKGKATKNPESKNIRLIYGFDLKSKKLSPEPVFQFNTTALLTFAKQKRISLPMRTVKGETFPVIKMMTSAIGIHPINYHLYLLSGNEHLLYIFNKKGELQHIEQLDEKLFNKAEGITFSTRGDVFISNEGQEGKPTLLFFSYKN